MILTVARTSTLRPVALAWAVAFAHLAVGCGTSPGGVDGEDAGPGSTSEDAGPAAPGNDSGPPDLPPGDDAGPSTDDAGPSGEDAGPLDAGELTGPGWSTGDHPRMYVNGLEITAIRDRVRASDEPWTGAYRRAISDADTALSAPPRSVRDGGGSRSSYFDTEVIGTDRHDYFAAIDMSRAIRDLGMGYALTGEARYADRAIALIDHWALDPDTSMNPSWTDSQSQIELSITMPGIFYGADLIWEYPGWGSADRDAFQDWATRFAADVRGRSGSDNTNNFGSWRLVMLASAAVIAEDSALLEYVFSHYRALAPNQISSRGYMGWERDRTTGLSYSTYAVNALAQVAEIARHYGVDLYHFVDERGRGSLERAFDHLAPYATNPDTWPREQIRPFRGENTPAYELAYLIWGKPEYLAVVTRWGRPAYDSRTAGPLTLTHARGAFVPFAP